MPKGSKKSKNKTPSNAAELYIKSLQSNKSKILMASRLNIISMMIDKNKNYQNFDWSILSYEIALNIISELEKNKKAPSTINSYLSAIKGTAKQAWKLKQLKTDVYLWIKEIDHIKGNRINKGRALEVSEIKKLIKICENDFDKKGKRDAAIIAITYAAGLRRDETVNLKKSDYDKSTGTLRIKGKGNKERKNKINSKIKKLFDNWVESTKNENELIFSKINGKKESKLTGSDIYNIINKRYKQAKIKKISPHDLRRTYATKLLENGEDIFIVQELMGHADVNTTKRYDKRSDIFKNKAAEGLPF